MTLADPPSRGIPRFGIRRQAALAGIMLLAMISIVTATAYLMHGRIAESINRTVSESRRAVLATQVMAAATACGEQMQAGIAARLDGQDRAQTDAAWQQSIAKLSAAIDDYAAIDGFTRAEAAGWRHLADDYAAAAHSALLPDHSTSPADDEEDAAAQWVADRARQRLIEQATAAARRSEQEMQNSNRAATRESATIYWLIGGRAVIAFALAEFLLLTFSLLLLRRIKTLTRAVEQVTAGDLDTRLPGRGYDEIGILTQKFNAMADALKNARDRFELTVRGSADGTWEWNSTSDRIYFSPRFKQMLGYDETETAAFENFLEMIHPDDRDSVYKMVFDHFESHIPFAIDFRVRTRCGEYQWFHGRGQAMWDATGKATRIAGSISNVMDRYRAEQQLREAKETAEDANRAKSEFLANMSHEIRTPMTAILGFADVIFENGLTRENEEPLQIIKRNGEHLLEIINDILDLSKIEAGKMQLDTVPCSPCQILDDIVALMRVRADAKGLPLKLEYVGPIPATIRTDPTRLRQILINLIGNAIKFTEVGSVRVTVELVGAQSEQPRLRIDVIDTGIGLKQEQIGRLFQPFAQADTSTTRRFGGTGLGLTISKRLADVLGGAISVESEPGRGSRFTLTFATGPLDQFSQCAPAQPQAATSGDLVAPFRLPADKSCKVLLAEDGPDNQRLIAYVLRKFRAEVTIADNGRVAVELALEAERQGSPFQVVLMDMQMPVLDGYGAARALRQAGYRRTIVALTAHAMEGDREKCLAAGCDDYAIKPIDRAALSQIVLRAAVPANHPTDGPVVASEGNWPTGAHSSV